MKTLFKTTLFSILLSLLFVACSKEDSASIPEDPSTEDLIETPGQITEDDFESYEGDIGIVLDARPLVRKGYSPTEVTINVAASTGNFSETVTLDEYSYMAQLKFPLEDLSEDLKEALADGADITPEYKDASGSIIFSETFRQSFQSNPSSREANAYDLEETQKNQALNFRAGTSYYIQRMNIDGSPDTGTFTTTSNSDLDDVISASSNAAFNGNEANRSFTFDSVPNQPNTFLIRHTETGRYIRYATVTTTAPNNSASFFGMKLTPNTSLAQIENASDYHNYQFTFEKQDNGTYIIKNTVGDDLKQAPAFGLSFDDTINNTANGGSTVTAEARRWRIVTASVDWNVSNIGTTILPPVLPKPETSFEFNSVLTNCGSGTLSQTIDSRRTETVSNTVGWEETLSMSTSNSVSVTAGVDVEFSAQLFGTGTTVNASLETSYEHSWSSTETNSNWESENEEVQIELYTSRTVTVPSGNASLVYDVQQFYPETRVNYVQRLRIEGTDNGQLRGEEIRTLFYLTNFSGIITDVEDYSIVVTLKGTMTLDKIVDTESNVQDVPANCN